MHWFALNKYLTPSQNMTWHVANHKKRLTSVICQQGFSLWRDLVSLLFADLLQVIKVLMLTFGNSNLQLPPQIFYGIKVWRLARPLQDLNVFLSHCIGCAFWVIVMLQYPSTTHFQCPGWIQCPGPDVPLIRCSCPVPLAEKTPPKHNVSTSMFDSGNGVLGVIGSIPPPKHGELSWW